MASGDEIKKQDTDMNMIKDKTPEDHHHVDISAEDDEAQQSDPPNNNVLRIPEETVPLTGDPTPSNDDEDQNFDLNTGKNALTVAQFFVTISIILQVNRVSVTHHHLNLLVDLLIGLIGITLFIHFMIKRPCTRTASYQFALMVLGFVLLILCMAMRTFVTINPEISTRVTTWVFSGMIGIFGVNLWFALRLTEDNRPTSVNQSLPKVNGTC